MYLVLVDVHVRYHLEIDDVMVAEVVLARLRDARKNNHSPGQPVVTVVVEPKSVTVIVHVTVATDVVALVDVVVLADSVVR